LTSYAASLHIWVVKHKLAVRIGKEYAWVTANQRMQRANRLPPSRKASAYVKTTADKSADKDARNVR